MKPIESFRKIVSEASTAFLPESNADEIIPFGAELVQLVRSESGLRSDFELEFIEAARTAPPELIEFCMHALRWDSLQAYFRQCQADAISRNDWRAEPFYRHIVDSFDGSWEDAEYFYASYFRGDI